MALFNGNKNLDAAKRIIKPLVNIKETEKDVVLEAEMGGLTKSDISVELNGDELVIKGAKKDCGIPKGYAPVLRERRSFEYERAFVLGDDIDRSGINAKYENGILSLTLNKSSKTQPVKVEIK